ncbi:MAG: M48 family metalloprotease [Myxococcales bacterium]|nr:M48 family metalloprotease [Myxococcales bacterium]
MIRWAVCALLGLAACARPHYLGAAVPEPCRARDIDACLGWMVERDLAAAELGAYEDAELRGYVQAVVDRLARGSSLTRTPRVLLADRDGTYATVGGRIVVARPTLEKLGSEAELAGILAHEMAHIEGKHTVASLFGPHPDEDWLVMRRDAEAIADERAILLLETAGYAPVAMGRALRNVLTVEDEEHPAKDLRIARVESLAVGRGGFEGRDELYAHLAGMVVGRDPRAGIRIGDAWVIAALGIAFELAPDDLVRAADDLLVVRRGTATLTGYVLGAPWARELVGTLEDRDAHRTTLGLVTAGTVARRTARDDSPLGKLQRAIRSGLPQPAVGARVAILERRRGALILELGGRRSPELNFRVATPTEIATSEPARIAIAHAQRSGTIASQDACRGVLLDDPQRMVRAGDPIKCADRAPLARPADESGAEAAETRRDE